MSKRQRNSNNAPSIKLVLLGQEGVGKSALMVRFLTRRFIGEYDPKLESTHRRHISFGNSTLIVEMKDTAGDNDNSRRESDLLWGDAFILVYSVTSKDSLDEIIRLRESIEVVKNTSSIINIVVGNKKDLDHLREVKPGEGRELAQKFNSPFFEISVAEGYQETYKVFNEILRYVIAKKATEEGAGGKKRNNSFTYLLKGIEKQAKAGR